MRVRPGRLSIALLLITLVSWGGCSAAPKVDGPSEAQRIAFHEQLVLASREINDANLDQAKVHVQQARARAWDDVTSEKVASLELLIAGAQALDQGDAAQARIEWSRITDPALKREVRMKARAIGIDVPSAALENGKESLP